MKRASNAAMLIQFLSIAFWFATTLTSGVMYRLLISAMYFEFPLMLLLLQSVAFLALFHLGKTLLPDLCKSWNTSVDLKAFPASMLFSITVYMDYCFFLETNSARLLQLFVPPVVSFIMLNSSGSQRSKIGRKFPVVMAILSVVFAHSTMNVGELTPNGALFGISLVFFNVYSLISLRKYIKNNSASRFIYSHCTFVSFCLFIYELWQHDIHRLYLYVQVWQFPFFYYIISGFFVSSFFSLLSLCHVITQFDLTTIAISLNTKCAWQFVIGNYVFENIAKKAFYELTFSNQVSAAAVFLLNLAVFWIDSKKRVENEMHLRNVE